MQATYVRNVQSGIPVIREDKKILIRNREDIKKTKKNIYITQVGENHFSCRWSPLIQVVFILYLMSKMFNNIIKLYLNKIFNSFLHRLIIAIKMSLLIRSYRKAEKKIYLC